MLRELTPPRTATHERPFIHEGNYLVYSFNHPDDFLFITKHVILLIVMINFILFH